MLILSIDTSTRGCSVALHQDAQLLASYDLLTDKSSSAMLTTLVEQTVTNAGFSMDSIDAIAVAKGPGSYTGLRVAVSTAKGLCYALELPLIAINTLEAMALQVAPFQPEKHLLCPMIDARRMEVYAAVYNCNLHTILETSAIIIDESSFRDLLEKQPVVFFGDGAAKCQKVLGSHPNAVFFKDDVRPSARTIGQLAAPKFLAGAFEDVAAFEPYYLKDFMSPPPAKKNLATTSLAEK